MKAGPALVKVSISQLFLCKPVADAGREATFRLGDAEFERVWVQVRDWGGLEGLRTSSTTGAWNRNVRTFGERSRARFPSVPQVGGPARPRPGRTWPTSALTVLIFTRVVSLLAPRARSPPQESPAPSADAARLNEPPCQWREVPGARNSRPARSQFRPLTFRGVTCPLSAASFLKRALTFPGKRAQHAGSLRARAAAHRPPRPVPVDHGHRLRSVPCRVPLSLRRGV